MSSRALKRLGKASSLEDELAKYQKKVESDENESNDEGSSHGTVKKNAANAFAFLQGSEEEYEDSEESEGSDDEKAEVTEPAKHVAFSNGDTKTVKNSSKGKSKGKQNKAAKTVDDLDEDELDNILARVRLEDKTLKNASTNNVEDILSDASSVVDSIEHDLETEEVLPPWPVYTSGGKLLTPKKFHRSSRLLQVDPRDLNSDREYENLFGKLSSAAIDDADSTSSSTTRKLRLTKIKDDWLPIPKKPLSVDEVTSENLLNLYTTKFKDDWKEILQGDIAKDYKYGIKYYNVEPGPAFSIAATTEFFMSVVVQPDHESLIHLLQKYPYSIETILQVACILQRQGDNSNTNGLIERALFVFDWSLPNSFELGNGKSRLPFEYFLNRQIYLTIFRYISVLTQKSIFYTALTYCKLLLSFDPMDDPYGVRYLIDYYAFLSDEFQYLIDFVNSPLCRCYEEWLTAPLMYTVSLCYFKLGKVEEAKQSLKDAYLRHPFTGHQILEKLGDVAHPWLLQDVNDAVKIGTAMYTVRLKSLVEEPELKNFLTRELAAVIEKTGKPNLGAYYTNNLENIPENLVRNAVLSNESAVMAKIPESFWSENDVYEFDVLPPQIGTTIYNYVDDNQISAGVMQNTMQAEEIRQLQDLLQQNVVER
ncbi:hypothetical protein PMKS-001546 [Pichia membranifaciens]|uniref:Ribosome quality control complex subunit 1 n=1 Tax=Pichia membranifaciens TaxID=4926 RepID=A0A1Q2YEY7_9ASCO|nr:hypothetical protein PMKS-001546 [Pichia membranifaciens]